MKNSFCAESILSAVVLSRITYSPSDPVYSAIQQCHHIVGIICNLIEKKVLLGCHPRWGSVFWQILACRTALEALGLIFTSASIPFWMALPCELCLILFCLAFNRERSIAAPKFHFVRTTFPKISFTDDKSILVIWWLSSRSIILHPIIHLFSWNTVEEKVEKTDEQ